MRALEPDRDGFVERDGVKVFFEVFGTANETAPAILLLPTWSIVHSRRWKFQVPYLARRFRVVTFDGRGNGRSDRPREAAAYADTEYVEDAAAVLDENGIDRAVIAGISMGSGYALRFAAAHPERTLAAVFIGPAVGLADPIPARQAWDFDTDLGEAEHIGWAKENRHYWMRDWPGYVEFFIPNIFTEPHSTKTIEDSIRWALETDPETMLLIEDAPYLESGDRTRRSDARATTLDLASRVRSPCLVVQGTDDAVVHVSGGRRLAEALGCPIVEFEGSGHAPDIRDPVRFNLVLRDFVERVALTDAPSHGRRDPSTWTRAAARPRRALFISSPIGLGHALRDVAIATALRALRPDLEIDWLAQDPVTRVLAARGERIHPASAFLASESAHIESEAAEHDLRVFQAYREMDEILVANFHVFDDVVTDEPYDLVIGDEAWDVDHFWHENPELKRQPFVWLTDFVGWLPLPEGGDRESFLTADYNSEMIGHVERFPRLRDRAIFVGGPEDLPDVDFGPYLPPVRAWTEEHFAFAGYVSGFDPSCVDRDEARAEFGYRDGEPVCLVTVGGSGVGEHLLRRVIQAHPETERLVPGLRMVVVAGPRIDPRSLDAPAGVEVLGYVDHLQRRMAAADVAVVQGGLTTTMELTALGTPFVYIPLRGHFEQQLLVPRRLARYGAGRRLDYAEITPDALAAAISSEMRRQVDYLPVETDGAARVASMIAQLL
jgi:pimeloyl-ACP methyl ester carboxylesterase/predicted glycosyltransferase